MALPLTPEQAIVLMEKMIEKGMVPDAMLEDVRLSQPDSRVLDAAELLHTLLCSEEHGMDGGDCLFHAEAMYPDPSENPHQRRWIIYTETLLQTYSLKTEELKALVNELVELNILVRKVGDEYQGEATAFILDAIRGSLPKPPPVQAAL